LRATVEDPKDGESLIQYAKLVWEVYCDKERALSFFERAALVAPEDRYVFIMILQPQIFFFFFVLLENKSYCIQWTRIVR